MKEYAEIYSEYGLKEMIEDNKNKLQEKHKEYKEVCEGKRYNPLCADGWKKEIQNEIKEIENHIKELENALEVKRQYNNCN